jgi:2-methylcitrate dehydratase PrpD
MMLEEIAEWASSVRFEDLKKEARASVREVVLDDLGVIVAGHREEEVQGLLAEWQSSSGNATMLGQPQKLVHPWTATELNGIAGCWLELDGGFRTATAHAGLYTIPAALATAEVNDLLVEDLLMSVVVGYEVAARIVTRWDIVRAGSHAHGSVAALAAAASCAKALGLDRSETAAAIGCAATLAMAAPFNHAVHGSLARNIWAGSAGRLGCVAVHCAQMGLTALPTVLDDVYHDVFSAEEWRGPVIAEFGTAIIDAYHKPYSCCQFLHSSVEASLEIRGRIEQDGLDPARIERVVVSVSGKALEFTDRSPKTSLGARFSLPHATAAALVLGSGGPLAFSRAAAGDGVLSQMRERVDIVERSAGGNGGLDDRGSRVSIKMDSGETFSAEIDKPLGDPSRPIERARLVDKFVDLIGADREGRATDRAVDFLDGRFDDNKVSFIANTLLKDGK